MRTTQGILCVGIAALCAVVAFAGPLHPSSGSVSATSPSLADIHAAVTAGSGSAAADTASTPGSATDGRPWPATGEMRVAFDNGVPLSGLWTIADLAGSIEVIEFREGTEGGIIPLPGDTQLPAVTLIRPLSADLSASGWFEQVVAGDIAGARANATLILFDSKDEPIAQWKLLDCWPHAYDTRVEGGAASEQITITMEGLLRVQ